MRTLNRRSLLFGAILPIIAIIFMGAYDVLDRYNTIRAHEMQIIDEEGTVLLNLSELVTMLNQVEEEPTNYDQDINSLGNQIKDINSKLSRMVSKLNEEPKNNFISVSSFNEKVTSLESMISSMNDLNVKMNQNIADLEAKLGGYKSEAPASKECGPNCTKSCCANKQQLIEVVEEEVAQESAVDVTGDIEMLKSSLNTFMNSNSIRLGQIESDMERISSNQDMIMRVLRKDLKKLNKK